MCHTVHGNADRRSFPKSLPAARPSSVVQPRTVFRFALTLQALLVLLEPAAVSADSSRPSHSLPNVVLIYADDLGYGDLGCYGATRLQTPNIDRLAAQGRRFTDAHSASAVCTPSRYGLLTGQYPLRAMGGRGTWGPLSPTSGLIIGTNTMTIGKVFQNKGYATACLGKWHLGFKQGKNDWQVPLRPGPLDVGFDHYFGVPHVNSGSPYVYVEDDTIVGYDPNDPLIYGGQPVSPTPRFPEEASRKSPNRFAGALRAHRIYDDEKTGTRLAERAVRWITEKKDQPFFLYFPTPNIHHPFTPAPRFKGTSDCGLYGDFVHELDWMVGEILKCLDENGLADHTLVLFTSDNGGMLNRAGRDAMRAGHRMNGDLLGFKFGVWEGGHRVPLIARWPGKIKAGTVSSQLIGQVDLLATFLALTGQRTDSVRETDSINMLPALLDDPEQPLRTDLLLAPRQPRNLAIRKGKWVYIGARGSGGFTGSKPAHHAWGGPAAAAFAGSVNSDLQNGKIRKDAPPAQLYDLQNDPAQTTNVYRQHPEVVREMQILLAAYRPADESGDAPPKQNRHLQHPVESRKPELPKLNSQNDVTPAAPVNSSSQPKGRAENPVPNFVVIFTDDQGYGDLSCFGGQHVSTPRIDQMAAEGCRLTSFYVAAPVCTPSRAALMTGCYPKRIDMATGSNFGVLLAADPKGLHPDESTIAEVLKSAGYQTGIFGKWHLGDQPAFLPTRQGFDQFFGIPFSHDIHPFHPRQNHFRFPPLPLLDGDTVIELDPNADDLTRRITERAVSFIRSNSDTPFFLYVPHPIPHRPLHVSANYMKDVPPEVTARLKNEDGTIDYGTRDRLFRQAIAEIDWSVGRILDTLKNEGLDEQTLVLFTSDNGPAIGSAGPLRGRKGSTFEGGMRESTVVRWPGQIPPGTANHELMTTMDLLPTFAKLAGAGLPTDRIIDGKDIWPTLTGRAPSPHQAFFYHRGNTLNAVRSGKWKLHLKNGKPAQLYDLQTDIGESNNVIRSHPEVVTKLNDYLQKFEADIAAHSRPAAFVKNPVPLSMKTQ